MSHIEYYCDSTTKSSGFTPLMHAVMDKDLNKVKELLKDTNSKDFINTKNTKGWTALHLACRNSRIKNKEVGLKIVVLLLKSEGVDVNLQEINGCTALMMASSSSSKYSTIGTVDLLLKYGADVNLKNIHGYTPLMMASVFSNKYSSNQTVELLLKYKANVNLQDNDGQTALMMASEYSNTKSSIGTVELLLKYGADINLQDNNKKTVLDIAIDLKFKDVIKLLTTYNYTKEIEELKEKHKQELENQKLKLLEEMYAPGGIGMEVAKERFEKCKYF